MVPVCPGVSPPLTLSCPFDGPITSEHLHRLHPSQQVSPPPCLQLLPLLSVTSGHCSAPGSFDAFYQSNTSGLSTVDVVATQRRRKANESNAVGAAGRTVTSHRRGSRILGHPGEETEGHLDDETFRPGEQNPLRGRYSDDGSLQISQ